jgi:hypothetical protein
MPSRYTDTLAVMPHAVNFDALPLPDISFEVRVPPCLPPVKPGAGSGESQAGDIGRGSGRRSYRQQP